MAKEKFNAICQICGLPMKANPGSGVAIHPACLQKERDRLAKKEKPQEKSWWESTEEYFSQTFRGRKRKKRNDNKEKANKNKKKKNGNGK